jgi:biotin carboxylase
MAHIVFADLNRTGPRALRYALEAGHQVSLVIPDENRIFLSIPDFDRMLSQCWRVQRIPAATVAGFTQALAALHATTAVDAVIVLEESSLEAASLAVARLGLRGTSAEAVHRCRDKSRMRDTLVAAGQPSVPYRNIGAASDAELLACAAELGYPLVFKPIAGLASVLTAVVHDDDELRRAHTRWREEAASWPDHRRGAYARGALVERHVPGRLISAEIARNRTGTSVLALNGRACGRADPTIELGFLVPPALARGEQRACIAAATSALDALGLDVGLFHIEMILGPDGPVLIDANARLLGGDGPEVLADATGLSFYGLLLDAYLDRPLPPSSPLPIRRCVASRKIEATEDLSQGEIDRLHALLAGPRPAGVAWQVTELATAPVARGRAALRYRVLADDPVTAADEAERLHEAVHRALDGHVLI